MTTQAVNGLVAGAQTRARAKAAGRPVSYQVLIDLGWYWAAATFVATPHLVPPHGDRALCGHGLRRADRHPTNTNIAERACGHCWHAALGSTPRRTRA